jgi:hypothetical protein
MLLIFTDTSTQNYFKRKVNFDTEDDSFTLNDRYSSATPMNSNDTTVTHSSKDLTSTNSRQLLLTKSDSIDLDCKQFYFLFLNKSFFIFFSNCLF